MRRLLLHFCLPWLLLLAAAGTGYAQQASASLECCADQPICAGETTSLLVALEGKAPYTFRYSDGIRTETVSTSEKLFELKVAPQRTQKYVLISMQDAAGSGTVCGSATVAVNQCQPPASGKDCASNCFSSKIIQQSSSGSCTTYTLEVTNDGSCSSALSHFNISVPCGSISQASNSRGWPMEIGTTDPTTGISGIKVDNIKGFGENGKAGSFTVTYTICANSCSSADPYCGFLVAYKAGQCVNYGTATPPYQPMSGQLAATAVRCHGETGGSIALSLSGGAAPYTYQWSNGATTANLEGVAAGTYSVLITDGAGKTLSLSATVSQPQPLSLQASVSNSSCGTANGSIDLMVAGGIAPYTYLWNSGAATQDLSGLPAGTYSLTVTDASGCTATGSYTIAPSGSPIVALSGGNSGCSALPITASVSGGTAPYTYKWDSGETSASISPATAGTYSLTVTDASGCTTTASITTTGSSDPLALTYEYASPSCHGDTDGWIDLNVSGGTAPYTYSWTKGATSQDLEGVAAGTYTVTVTDTSGCTATATITLPAPPAITVFATEIMQADCQGNGGSISVSANNGSGSYTYQWTHGPSGPSLEDLEPGYYTVAVEDEFGCKSVATFQIKAPTSPQLSISGGACGSSTLTANVTGGSGPYTYTWSNGQSTESISAEEGTHYTVVVTDANGCTAEADIEVGQIGNPISLSATTTPPSCAGGNDGSIDLEISGGSGTYTIVWSNGATTEDQEQLSAGTYTVVVSDGSGCSQSLAVIVSSPAPLSLTATEIMAASCNSPGGLTVDAQGGTGPYTYQWHTGETGPSLDDVPAGSYTVVVTDSKNCQTEKTFTIQQQTAPQLQIASIGNCTSQQLSALVSGNTGPYTYLWSTGATSSSITATVSGLYSVVVTDAGGCTSTAEIPVHLSETTLSLYAQVEALSCGGSADGAASITASGGTAPYTYDWSNGLNTASATNLAAGVYSVKVSDSKGCYDVIAFEIKQSAPISIVLSNSSTSSCGQPNGSLSIAASGGTAPYTYKWNTGATSPSLTAVTAGLYTIAVIDALGCAAEASFRVEESTAGSPLAGWIETCTDLLIQGGTTATFAVHFEGTGPYTFTYTDGNSTQSVTTSDNPYALSVQPTQNSVYRLLSVSNSCGEGEALGSATVAVVWPKTQVCTDGCFSTNIISSENSGSCTTYTLKVSADGSCTYALSHFNIALMCGQVSNMSNSKGWPMTVGQDPTTGLYSIKVDDINMKKEGSFTVTYTLCNTESCIDAQNYCGPLVAYKAGQCVYYGQATPAEEPVTELPDDDGFLGPDMQLSLYKNPMDVGTGLTVQLESLFTTATVHIFIANLMGHKVYETSVVMSPLTNYTYLQLSQLPPGTYVVYLTIGKVLYSEKLIVQ